MYRYWCTINNDNANAAAPRRRAWTRWCTSWWSPRSPVYYAMLCCAVLCYAMLCCAIIATIYCSLVPFLFHRNAASLTPSGLADRSVAWWFTSDSLSRSSQPSATGGLTQSWLWPPLPRGSPGCNGLAARVFLHSLSSPPLPLGRYFPEGHNPARTHWPGSVHWNPAYSVTSQKKADGSQQTKMI